MYILGGCRTVAKSLLILIKSTLFNWVMYFSLANIFFPSIFPHIWQCQCQCGCSVGHAKTCSCFSKFCKAKIEFFRNIWMTRNSEKKTSKSCNNTAVQNNPGNNTKKSVNLILEIAVPKAIIGVYLELLVTNFYAQISCCCHSKFVKIISILMHHIAITVFVYISFPASTKMFWLATCPTNSGQKQWPSSISYNNCK